MLLQRLIFNTPTNTPTTRTAIGSALATLLALLFVSPAAIADLPAWAVTDDDSHIHLVGSVHLLKEDDLPLPVEITSLVAHSTVVLFESDMSRQQDVEYAMQVQRAAMYAEDDDLTQHLSQTTYQRLVAAMEPYGVPEQAIQRFPAWYWYLAFPFIWGPANGYQPEFGVDLQLYSQAQTAGKKTEGLEDPEQVFAMFQKIDDAEAEALLNDLLDEMAAGETAMREIVVFWQNGDVAGLQQWWDEHSQGADSFVALVQDARNQAWMARIKQALADNQAATVVVGLGHMIGDNSLLNLLQRDGFHIEQLQ